MKISGNKRDGRYVQSNGRNELAQTSKYKEAVVNDPRAVKAAAKKKRRRRARRVIGIIFFVILALIAVIYCMIKLGVKPPDMKPKMPHPTGTASSAAATPKAASDRKGNQYTFVILGVSGGNSDTMMVANFDADKHKLNIVNIPRDTLVNVAWYTKKANSIYPNKGIDGVMSGMSDILGFQPDFYMNVDLKAFEELVDAVGGIDFDVPVNMDYDDPAQDLSIHFTKGVHHLDGKEAMEVVRFRHGYADADIGRIRTQQSFMASAAAQILKKQNQLNLDEIAGIFIKYVKTDLSLGNLVWLGKEFYKLNASDITFTTMPGNYGDEVNGTSYVTIYVNDWLKLLNEKINPFKDDIKESELSILTRNKSGSLYVTDGNWAGKSSWGSGTSESSGPASSPSPSQEKPSPSPKPSNSPGGSASPSPSGGKASPSPSVSGTSPSISPTNTGTSPSPSGISPSPSGTSSPSPGTPPNASPGPSGT